MNAAANSVARRVVGGLGANAFNQVVIIIVQLAGIPLLLHYWGAQLYGEWLILFAVPAYLSMTDLGFSISAGNDMTASAARGDMRSALAVFQSLGVLVVVVSASGVALTAVVLGMAPVPASVRLSPLSGAEVRWVLWLLASEVFVRIVEGAVHAGFRANGEYPLYFTIFSGTLLVQQATIWATAAIGYGPVGAAVAYAAIRWVVTPSLAALLFHRHRWLQPGFQHASLRELRRLFRPAMANLAVPLSQAVSIQGMVLVVGALLGPVPVVVFSALRTLSRIPRRLAMGAGQALEPELAAAWGRQDTALVRKLYIRGLSACIWLSLALASVLLFSGRWVLAVWTHGKIAMDTWLFNWLLVAAVMESLWTISLMLLRSANTHMRASAWYVASALAAVSLAAFLLNRTGQLSGAGLAVLVANALMAAYLSRVAARAIGMSTSALLIRVLDASVVLKYLRSGFGHAR